ncbi:MAG: YncE family protein [Gammaproteobacteria bacterium]
MQLVSSNEAGVVEVVDAPALSWQRLIPVGKGPMDFAFPADEGKAYVANHDAGTISIIDLRSFNIVRTFAAGKGPETMAFY